MLLSTVSDPDEEKKIVFYLIFLSQVLYGIYRNLTTGCNIQYVCHLVILSIR